MITLAFGIGIGIAIMLFFEYRYKKLYELEKRANEKLEQRINNLEHKVEILQEYYDRITPELISYTPPPQRKVTIKHEMCVSSGACYGAGGGGKRLGDCGGSVYVYGVR